MLHVSAGPGVDRDLASFGGVGAGYSQPWTERSVQHFFFHYHTPYATTRDDIGCSFKTLELAYLDAYRSMVEIGAELLKRHRNPSAHRIEIADADGRSLMDLHFDEVFRPKRSRSDYIAEADILRLRVDKFRKLRQDLDRACRAARTSVEEAHEVLRRARERSSALIRRRTSDGKVGDSVDDLVPRVLRPGPASALDGCET